jgi:hypothetical protein
MKPSAIRPLTVASMLLVASCAVCGCSDAAKPGTTFSIPWTSPQGDAVPGVDSGLVLGKKQGNAVLFLVWTDGRNPCTLTERPVGSVVKGTGELKMQAAQPLKFELEARDPNVGWMTFDGVKYDFAAGNLFLVSTIGPKATVKQLKKDLSNLKLDRDALRAFASSDAEISAYFGSRKRSGELALNGEPAAPASPRDAFIQFVEALTGGDEARLLAAVEANARQKEMLRAVMDFATTVSGFRDAFVKAYGEQAWKDFQDDAKAPKDGKRQAERHRRQGERGQDPRPGDRGARQRSFL